VPTYEYACADCGERLEVVQKFSDDPLTMCAVCGGRLRKVFSPVGIVFKGSGFYRTDSRAAAANGSKDKKPNGPSSDSPAAADKPSGAEQKTGSPGPDASGSGPASGSSDGGGKKADKSPGAKVA
jgi:putative FmdB family regulatory protein